jgi:hypothetical protein
VVGTALALSGAARRNPWTVLVVLATIVVLCGLSWAWGNAVGRGGIAKAVAKVQQAHADEVASAVEEAQQEHRERERMGNQAAADLRGQLAERDARIATLKREVAHVPKVVKTAQCPEPGVVRMSVGAVRLYDTALTGGAHQQLPGSACGAAGAASAAADAGACSAASEQPSAVTVDRFTDVATFNAELHGECMTRFKRLASFLEARDRAAGVNSAKGGGLSE